MENTFQKELYLINNLRNMQVVEINSGKILGFIGDMVIDCENYKIKSIIIPMGKKTWFRKSEFLQIPWNRIHKVGVDVILVSLKDIDCEENLKCKDIILNNEENLV